MHASHDSYHECWRAVRYEVGRFCRITALQAASLEDEAHPGPGPWLRRKRWKWARVKPK